MKEGKKMRKKNIYDVLARMILRHAEKSEEVIKGYIGHRRNSVPDKHIF
jgi:hypothetical protein